MKERPGIRVLWNLLRVVAVLGVVGLLGFLGILCLWGAWNKLAPALGASSLPEAAATVTVSKVESFQSTSQLPNRAPARTRRHRAVLAWKFQDNERPHRGAYREEYALESNARRLVEKFPAGSTATVVFDPATKKTPSWLVVGNGIVGRRIAVDWAAVVALGFFGALFLGIVLWLLVGTMRDFRRPKHQKPPTAVLEGDEA